MTDQPDLRDFMRAQFDRQNALAFEREQRMDERLEKLASGTNDKINRLTGELQTLGEQTDARINKLAEKVDSLADSMAEIRVRMMAIDEHRRLLREISELRERVAELERRPNH